MRIALFCLLIAPLAGCKEHDHHHGAAPAPTTSAGPASNAVQAEMRLLDQALRDAVGAIGAGDVRSVEHGLHRVHGAMEATEKAVEGGSYKPPRGADKLPRFKELDRAFHAELEKLAEASRANDVGRTATQLGVVLGRCQGCHDEVRGPLK